MDDRYVLDTVSFINFHNDYFKENDKLSAKTRALISQGLDPYFKYPKIIIPSIVFVEIFRKFITDEEKSKKFYYDIFVPLKENIDVEIKPLEKEVLEYLPQIGPEHELELHDKIIYASACQLRCTLVSSDIKIINANKHVKFVPQIIF